MIALMIVTLVSGSSSSERNTTNERIEVLQEELRMRVALRSHVGTSTRAPSSTTPYEVETVYSCVVGVPSNTNEKKYLLPLEVGAKFQMSLTLDSKKILC